MSQSVKRKIYLNEKQIQFLNSLHKRKMFMGGRGVGKSTVLGTHNYIKFRRMPRAKSVLLGITYNNLMNMSVPAMEQGWHLNGLQEYDPRTRYGHYVVGIAPPKKENWIRPWAPPREYHHIISFLNGYTIDLMSQERPDKNRGGSYDAGDGDEFAILKKAFVDKIANASIRGNIYRYEGNPLHHSFCGFTSAPWTVAGQHIFRYEELMIEEMEKVKAGLLKPEECEYLFVEARTVDNLDVLGKDYLERMKRELDPWSYKVEIENFRLKKLPNGFYPSLDPEHHCPVDIYEYGQTEKGRIYTKQDTFINKKAKLLLSFDFNASFTSMIVCQETDTGRQREFRIGDALFIKPGDTSQNLIDALVDKFIEEYKGHGIKVVDIYGDRNGNNKSPATNRTFYEQIIQRLEKAGWICTKKVDGLDMDHDLRHILINGLLREEDPRWPVIRFHPEKARPLVLSMQNAPILPGYKKDKGDEKRPVPQELATHLSDCLDNILCRLYNSLLTGNFSIDIWVG